MIAAQRTESIWVIPIGSELAVLRIEAICTSIVGPEPQHSLPVFGYSAEDTGVIGSSGIVLKVPAVGIETIKPLVCCDPEASPVVQEHSEDDVAADAVGVC